MVVRLGGFRVAGVGVVLVCELLLSLLLNEVIIEKE